MTRSVPRVTLRRLNATEYADWRERGAHPQRPGTAFVWDVRIGEQRRGRGFGRATMLAAEQLAREQGWRAIGLNVFGANIRARQLYNSLGYETVSVQMRKQLPR